MRHFILNFGAEARLYEMSFYTEFDPVMDACLSAMLGTLEIQGVHNIVEAQMQMATKLKALKHKRTQSLVKKYKEASILKHQGNMQGLLSTYIDIQQDNPYLGNVAYQIVLLLSQIWPEGLGSEQVSTLVFQSDFVVKELYSMTEQENTKYQRAIKAIDKQINGRNGSH